MIRLLKTGLLCLGALLASCSGKENPTIAATGISLDKMVLTLDVGAAEILTATVIPVEASNRTVVWASSDKSVATVDGGLVTAIAAGAATISATAEDGGWKAECKVTVQAVAVEGVSLDKSALALSAGGSEQLTAILLPENATNKQVRWVSADPGVATVSGGMVAAVASGITSVTATTVDGSKTATCAVTVITPIGNAGYLAGEWKLAAWTGSGALAGKVFLKLNADKSFVMYQNLNEAGYSRYAGTFQYDAAQQQLSGSYSDGVAWKRAYKVGKISDDSMMWFDKQNASDVTNYVREAIPDYVKAPAAAPTRVGEERFL